MKIRGTTSLALILTNVIQDMNNIQEVLARCPSVGHLA